MKYETVIEKLMQLFTSEPYEQEVSQARDDFYKRAGKFDEESSDFEMKMSQFTDWYLFSRGLGSLGKAPIQAAVDSLSKEDWGALGELGTLCKDGELNPNSKWVKNLAETRHSLFEFLKTKGEDIYLRDLFSDYKLVVKSSGHMTGFDKYTLFEARLIPDEGGFVFSGAFCFHPPQASKYILKEVKKVKKIKDDDERDQAREDLINRLFRMRYKHEHYRHVDLMDIYSDQPKLRL
jgi:hypothetical protein